MQEERRQKEARGEAEEQEELKVAGRQAGE